MDTVEKQAQRLAEEVDYQKRQKEFSKEVDALIAKYEIGLLPRIVAPEINQVGTSLFMGNLTPQLQLIDLKKIKQQAAAQAAKEDGAVPIPYVKANKKKAK